MIPALLFAFQAAAGGATTDRVAPPPGPGGEASARSVRAVRAARPPVLDGRDDDEVWRIAERIVAFRQ
ncbi:MAG TPA: hypothetical protein VF368_03950, partial [Gemmatimonadaceae bacterium]